ncbi:hypothetical protein SARC_14877, partial [Sphaeroforma arctica JP610]
MTIHMACISYLQTAATAAYELRSQLADAQQTVEQLETTLRDLKERQHQEAQAQTLDTGLKKEELETIVQQQTDTIAELTSNIDDLEQKAQKYHNRMAVLEGE